MTIEYVTLPIKAFVGAQGTSEDDALNQIKQSDLQVDDFFTFDFIVSQGDKENITHLAYATYNGDKSLVKNLHYVELKHPNFIKLTLNHDLVHDYLRGKLNQDIETFLKKENHKIDYSKVYGLIQKNEDNSTIFIQYK
jgi:hypothetical protein